MTDWKRKLLAFLHDPPSKCLDIARHGEQSRTAMLRAGFTEDEVQTYSRPADHTAAAADRFPFPNHQASGLRCHFDGHRAGFHHPLGGSELKFHAPLSDISAIEGEGDIQPVLNRWPTEWTADQLWQARFMAHWRLWPQFAAQHDYRFGFLPGDTRLPDHTIWNHMQVVAALASCAANDAPNTPLQPAFLKFNLGPVQDFIAQSRSTRDQWSGSYLLSWLMVAGLKRLSELAGPDAVIYPSLRGQPLFDLRWRRELWDKVFIGQMPVWESFQHQPEDLGTPNIPNVFLALVPAGHAQEIAEAVEAAIEDEFAAIATECWVRCENAGLVSDEGAIKQVDRKTRFDRQVKRFLSLSWQVTIWPESVADAQTITGTVPTANDDGGRTVQQRLQALKTAATVDMPTDHRDGRFYIGSNAGAKDQLNNVGIVWAALVALCTWRLDAIRQVRSFEAWNSGGWASGVSQNKDSLSGKEEAVAGGREWLAKCDRLAGREKGHTFHPEQGQLANRFKHDDWLGAITLIKRVWDIAYLKPKWGLDPIRMPNTRGLANHRPFENSDDDEDVERQPEDAGGGRYFAVLAFDGDRIGKWVAGDLTPKLGEQLAAYTDGSGNAEGARSYFDQHLPSACETQRPVSPSYHLQFSEALTNFALKCSRPIVEAFDGRLIYSGGDDVLALVPADTALACAEALEAAFTGKQPSSSTAKTLDRGCMAANVIRSSNDGFLERIDDCTAPAHRRQHADRQGKPIPFIVPGVRASASVGVAIAHFKAPLQDVIRAARIAEKRAKSNIDKGGLGRSALAVTLVKRSGEIIEWGCRWDSGGLELYDAIQAAISSEQLSAKFPHRIAELLTPYLTQPTGLSKPTPTTGFNNSVDEIIVREFQVAFARQRGPRWPKDVIAASSLITDCRQRLERYLASSSDPQRKVRDIIGLCQTVAFACRTRSEKAPETQAERQTA